MKSPLHQYQEHLDRGELAYQVDGDAPVFYPRVVAPVSGATDLEWRVSKGQGSVYATTTAYYKGETPLNVALIELDEGFRMMSRVEDIPAEEVRIGMRVTLRVQPAAEGRPALPVFVPAQTEAAA
jgi:uncharacterized OB-fold protein